MGKLVVIFEATESDPIGEDLRGALRERFPMEDFTIYPLYREAYDIDYNMTIFRCFQPAGDPQPLLANDEYEFSIGLVTTPENFERIQAQVEHMADALSVDYLSYTSKGKPVQDESRK